MLKIKDNKTGNLVAVLNDEDSEPQMVEECNCNCKKKKENKPEEVEEEGEE